MESDKTLTSRIKSRIKDLHLVKSSTSSNKELLHRIDELQSLLSVLHIHTTVNGTLIEKITDLDGPLWKGMQCLNWLGQVVTDTGEAIYHTFSHNGVCISPGLSNKERLDLSIDNYGA